MTNLLFRIVLYLLLAATGMNNLGCGSPRISTRNDHVPVSTVAGDLQVSEAMGEGLIRGPKKTLLWFQEEAARGDAFAQNALGMMHYKGDGLAGDLRRAEEWFLRAAKQEYAPAMVNLGLMAYHGTGVPKSIVNACAWFILGANATGPQHEVERASRLRDDLADQMTADQRTEAGQIARDRFERFQR